MMIHIPPEIIDLILENTQVAICPWESSNRRTRILAVCSLVGRSWRSLAQIRLFEKVRLDITRTPLDQFLACLESSPLIAAAIRSLCIHIIRLGAEHPLDIENEPEELHVSPVLLMKVAAQLSPRAELTLETFTLLGWPSETPLPTTPVRLHSLRLSRLAYKPFLLAQTTSFDLTSFFELDEIYFADGWMLATTDATRTLDVLVLPAATRPVARSVHFYAAGADCFAACNLQCGGFDPGYLKSVAFCMEDSASLQFVSAMLRLHSGSVRNLRMTVISDVFSSGEAGECPLSPRGTASCRASY